MLGPIGSNLMMILRVLTPLEIERYSDEVSSDENAVALAAGAENLSTSQHQSGSTLTNSNKKQQNGLADEDDELKAKIIPINETVKKELLEIEEQEPENNNLTNSSELLKVESSGLESIGVLSRSQMAEIEAQKLKQENDKKESTTVFILNQREKLKNSQNKLAEQAAILQYRKNASQEFIKHEISDEDLDEDYKSSTSGSCGILVNKKHY